MRANLKTRANQLRYPRQGWTPHIAQDALKFHLRAWRDPWLQEQAWHYL
jgi:hypothetical protein